jgi:hypothetical protein
VRSWQFGLRRRVWAGARPVAWSLLLLVAFIVLSVIWGSAVHAEKEKLLEQLGSNEGTALLLLSAALTCVIAPICEEFLFRGFIFTALRNWRGTLAGGADHRPDLRRRARRLGAGARPRAARRARLRAVPALPLHGLAVSVHRAHSLNNSIAFRQPRGLGLLAGDRADRSPRWRRSARSRWRPSASA